MLHKKCYFCNRMENLEKDGDIAFFVFNGKISLSEELKNPIITKKLAQLSARRNLLLFVNFVAEVEEKQYLSVMVIDCGKILGVSDCLTDTNFSRSSRQRIYSTTVGKAGVIVASDAHFGGSVSSLFENGADFIVHMSDAPLNKKLLRTLKAHAVFCPLTIFSASSDAFCISCDGFLPKPHDVCIPIDISTADEADSFSTIFAPPSFEY